MCWRFHHTFVSCILDQNHLVRTRVKLRLKESMEKLSSFSGWMCLLSSSAEWRSKISKTHFYMWIFIFYSCLLFSVSFFHFFSLLFLCQTKKGRDAKTNPDSDFELWNIETHDCPAKLSGRLGFISPLESSDYCLFLKYSLKMTDGWTDGDREG